MEDLIFNDFVYAGVSSSLATVFTNPLEVRFGFCFIRTDLTSDVLFIGSEDPDATPRGTGSPKSAALPEYPASPPTNSPK